MMGDRPGVGETAAVSVATVAAFLYGVLPWFGWGLIGGIVRILFRPPREDLVPDHRHGFWWYLKVALRSSLVGLLVGVTLERWNPSWISSAFWPGIVAFCGFGASSFLALWDRGWTWIGENPSVVFRRVFRLPPANKDGDP